RRWLTKPTTAKTGRIIREKSNKIVTRTGKLQPLTTAVRASASHPPSAGFYALFCDEPLRRWSHAFSSGDPQRYRRCLPSLKIGIGSAVRERLLWSTTQLSFTFSRSASSVVVKTSYG